MAMFIVRIELHDPYQGEYTDLHKEMEKVGFTRQIESSSGQMYHLPPAEYHIQGEYTRARILAKAKGAVGEVISEASILVIEADGISWHGLKPVVKKKATR